MTNLASLFAEATAGFAALGLVESLSGWQAVRRFREEPKWAPDTPGGLGVADWPAVTVLKPLHGDEPLLEEALESFCRQDYPAMQIVFGVQDPADPAVLVVRRLRRRYPALDIVLVTDPTPHGPNYKIANLINMMPAARHDVLVISDSDIHVAPDYLRQVVATLQLPGTGVVTTLYSGLPASDSAAAQLGALQITHSFLPGAVLSRAFGRQDCMGATMGIRRDTLDAVGGMAALVQHLADDAMLGRLVKERGLAVRMAGTIPATTVPEEAIGDLFHHELRWGRTIRSLAPLGYAASSVQFPLFWSLLSVGLSGGRQWSLAIFAAIWLGRMVTIRGVDAALGLASFAPIWLLPLRDVLSMMVILASYGGDQVRWRGRAQSAARPRLAPGEG
jgi:ceramide glucosyltransferase